MRWLLRLLIVLMILGAISAASIPPTMRFFKERNRPKFELVEIDRGTIRSSVTATGEIKPTLSVSIGSFVSGPVVELYVDFNTRVKKDQLLAKIDPRTYKASVARDQAALATRNADIQRVEAQLQQAVNDESRALQLHNEDPDYVSQAELDRLKFGRLSLEAQLVVAKASVKQAQANLDNSLLNLDYTNITAPTDGMVIDRKIDPGQTLASAFQTPELFIVAPDMEKEMHVYASIDEAEIGQIKKAKLNDQQVRFRVDAYPGEIFQGKISQIRLSSTQLQNVVTYPVIVSAANPDLKLLPGMTANLTFLIEEKKEALRVPRSALRFYPKREMVHPDDRDILDGASREEKKEGQATTTQDSLSADEQLEEYKKRNKRHVWIVDDKLLRAVEVTIGISENKYYEIVAGDLQEGQEIVNGVETKR